MLSAPSQSALIAVFSAMGGGEGREEGRKDGGEAGKERRGREVDDNEKVRW